MKMREVLYFVVNYIDAAARELLVKTWSTCHSVIGNARRLRSYVRKTWPGADPAFNSRLQAIYAHYDAKGIVHNYVIKQLEALVEAGFRTTFVSNSPSFPAIGVSEVAPFCRQILWRRNIGYDFGAYKDGIAALGDLDECERLLLMNDSVYGPFYPLGRVLAGIDHERTDFWGITDSWQHHFHIQSYFILFLRKALNSPAFRQFWHQLPYVNSKRWIIHNSEVRLTQVLTQNKLRANVHAPYWKVARAVLNKLQSGTNGSCQRHQQFLDNLQDLLVRGVPQNPSSIFWEPLIVDFGCPFLKREIITRNPEQIPFIWRWDEVLACVSAHDPEVVRRHLQAL